MKAGNCCQLPSADDVVGDAVDVAAELLAATEGQVVVAGDREVVGRVEEGGAVICSTVIGILPIGALRGTRTAARAVVAEVVGEDLAVGVVGEELEPCE